MEIEFFGANCFRLKTKETTIVIDDTLATVGKKSIVKKDTGVTVMYTQKALVDDGVEANAKLVLDGPGEFEVGDISIKGLQVRSHMDEQGEETATVYQYLYANSTVTVVGHIHPDVSDKFLELAGGTDVLIMPVGGNGYTLDAAGAASIMKKVEPDTVIPSYYDAPGFDFEVPAAPLDDFKKTSGLVSDDELDSFKVGKTEVETAAQTALAVLKIK